MAHEQYHVPQFMHDRITKTESLACHSVIVWSAGSCSCAARLFVPGSAEPRSEQVSGIRDGWITLSLADICRDMLKHSGSPRGSHTPFSRKR